MYRSGWRSLRSLPPNSALRKSGVNHRSFYPNYLRFFKESEYPLAFGKVWRVCLRILGVLRPFNSYETGLIISHGKTFNH